MVDTIPGDKWFYFSSGMKASSIEELKKALEKIDEAEFRHHVNNERNDFANWVEHVFRKTKLARTMREVSEKDGLLIILSDYLKKSHKSKLKPHEKIKRLIISEKRHLKNKIKKKAKPVPDRKLSEKKLSEEEIKGIVDDAKQVLGEEVALSRGTRYRGAEHYPRFIVKEFIYGFLLGLIFGLIMLGIIFNLKF